MIMVIRQLSALFNDAVVIHDNLIVFLGLAKNAILIAYAITTLTGKSAAVKETQSPIMQEKTENTGKQMEEKEEKHEKVCRKCGKPLPENAGFCVYCGTKQ